MSAHLLQRCFGAAERRYYACPPRRLFCLRLPVAMPSKPAYTAAHATISRAALKGIPSGRGR